MQQQQQQQDGGSSDEDEEGEEDDPDKKKQKRRSKNDVQGRDHRCNYCDKTYLSYPALYTHMKNKHAKGPDGQPLININSGRGRGRPKKNTNPNLRFSHTEPTSDNFFKTSIEKTGGPVEPVQGFKEVYTEIYIKRAKPVSSLPLGTGFEGAGENSENKDDGREPGENTADDKKMLDEDHLMADDDDPKEQPPVHTPAPTGTLTIVALPPSVINA